MQRTLTALETEVNYLLLQSRLKLDPYARILVRGRVKDCESAVDSLHRRQEGGTFDASQPGKYSLTALPDLVGVRILTVPHESIAQASEIVKNRIPESNS